METPEIDFNKIISDFLGNQLSHVSDKILGKGKTIFKGISDQVKLNLTNTYKDYLTYVAERYSKSKSFILKNESVNLSTFYVPLDVHFYTTKFQSKYDEIKDVSISELTSKSSFNVLTASAGMGKSMLMRFLLLDTL